MKPGTKESSASPVLGKPEIGGSRFDFDAISTRWQIESAEPLSRDLYSGILDRERSDTTYSRFCKGYLFDRLSALLRKASHSDFVVDRSGDPRHVGERAIRVGLEHSFDPRRVIGVAHLRAQALCASGTSQRTQGRRAAPRARRQDRCHSQRGGRRHLGRG
ncbi:FAD:protein FMN transferase [Streptomyces mirabilis]|uniref:FAD:protein FMN transferase n=1 Tax=Streptomyces mirabilis TaxID=68239 RepID=UPI00332C611B